MNPDEIHYYPFIISRDRCDGGFNAIENPFGRICVANKLENVRYVFNKIKEIN